MWYLLSAASDIKSSVLCFDRHVNHGNLGNCLEEPVRRALFFFFFFFPNYSKLLFRKRCFPLLSDWNLILHWGWSCRRSEHSLSLFKQSLLSKLVSESWWGNQCLDRWPRKCREHTDTRRKGKFLWFVQCSAGSAVEGDLVCRKCFLMEAATVGIHLLPLFR